jgi:uncharacterized lipoprotein YmbA
MRTDRLVRISTKLLATLIFVILLAGCARTPPVSYYQLSTPHAVSENLASTETGKGLTIGLGPVRLPEYLERPQIVGRVSANRLEMTDTRRWAEPLSEGLPRVLGENLAVLLDKASILRHPWPRSRAIDYRVVVEVLQFEAGPEREAVLTARWQLFDSTGTVLVTEKRSNCRVLAAAGTEGLVAALSDALWQLAREIAGGLKQALETAAWQPTTKTGVEMAPVFVLK